MTLIWPHWGRPFFTLDGVFDKNLGPALAVRYIKTNAEKQNSFLTRFMHLLNIITLCI